jgi:hypothetical protein
MTPEVINGLIAVGTIAGNALVTWGIVRTQLQWLRRDVDDLREWREDQTRRQLQDLVR